jgi:hypothetical protein
MTGAIPPLPQYAFMTWCLVKAQGLYLFYLTFTMCGTCSTHGSDEKCIKILVENLKGRDYLKDLNIDGRIVLECILGRMDSFHLI